MRSITDQDFVLQSHVDAPWGCEAFRDVSLHKRQVHRSGFAESQLHEGLELTQKAISNVRGWKHNKSRFCIAKSCQCAMVARGWELTQKARSDKIFLDGQLNQTRWLPRICSHTGQLGTKHRQVQRWPTLTTSQGLHRSSKVHCHYVDLLGSPPLLQEAFAHNPLLLCWSERPLSFHDVITPWCLWSVNSWSVDVMLRDPHVLAGVNFWLSIALNDMTELSSPLCPHHL